MDRYLRKQINLILYLLLLVVAIILGYYSGKYDTNIKQQKMELKR